VGFISAFDTGPVAAIGGVVLLLREEGGGRGKGDGRGEKGRGGTG